MVFPKICSRRHFLRAAVCAVLLLSPLTGFPIEKIERVNPRIKGVGLTTYSLRDQMHYNRGKTTSQTMEILGFLDYCAEHEIEAAELTAYYFKEPVEREYLYEVRRRAHLLGIDLAAGAIGNNFSFPPGSSEAKEQLAHTRTWIDHFSDLGIPVIRVFSGNPPKGMSEDEAIQNIVINLREALAYAGTRGVMLGLENHDFTSNVDRLLRVVKQIDSEWLGILFDSGNIRGTADPYAELERIAPYAVSAQIKVKVEVDGKRLQSDFDRVVKILREGGYGGYIILEYEESEDPLVAVPRYLEEIRHSLLPNCSHCGAEKAEN